MLVKFFLVVFEDVFVVVIWVCKNVIELKVDLDCMVVVGDDVGGSLVVSLMMMICDCCGKLLVV